MSFNYNETNEFFFPKQYDIFNNSCIADVPFYINYCRNNHISKVLELGVGTGRVAIPMAKTGITVYGVDNSLPMLNELEVKIEDEGIEGIHCVYQDMRNMCLNDTFDLIIVPFCTFNFLLSIEDQIKTLKSIKTHMSKNATVIFDLLTMNTFPHTKWDNQYYLYNIAKDGTHNVKIYIKNQFNQALQMLRQNRRFVMSDTSNKSMVDIILINRVFLLGEFQLLLDLSGFRISEVYGGYNYQCFECDSDSLVVFANLDET